MPGRYLNEFGQPLQGTLGSRQGKAVAVENRGNNGFAGLPQQLIGRNPCGIRHLGRNRLNQLSFQIQSA